MYIDHFSNQSPPPFSWQSLVNLVPVINCALGKSCFHMKEANELYFWNHICQNSLFRHLDCSKLYFLWLAQNVNWIISGSGGSDVSIARSERWPREIGLHYLRAQSLQMIIRDVHQEVIHFGPGEAVKHDVELSLESKQGRVTLGVVDTQTLCIWVQRGFSMV